MRLHTPVPIVNRTLEEPVVVDGEELPVGIMVDLCMYHTHNHPDVWQNPTVSFISIDWCLTPTLAIFQLYHGVLFQ